MKEFKEIDFDLRACESGLSDFRTLLDDIPLAGIRLYPPIDLGEIARLSSALLVARLRNAPR